MSEHGSGLGQVLGGFTDVKVNGVQFDMMIYESGLLLARHSHDDPKGWLHVLEAMPTPELLRRYRFVAFSDVTHARIVKSGIPIKVALDIVGGEQLEIAERWVSTLLGEDDRALLKDLLAKLRNTGPMSEAAAAQAARTWAEGAAVLDAMANVKVNGIEYDLIILDTGLVFVAEPGGSEQGGTRLAKLLEGTAVHEIVGRNWLIRYEQIVDARITKSVPVTSELELYDGLQLTLKEGWTGHSHTDASREVLVAALCSVGAVRP